MVERDHKSEDSHTDAREPQCPRNDMLSAEHEPHQGKERRAQDGVGGGHFGLPPQAAIIA